MEISQFLLYRPKFISLYPLHLKGLLWQNSNMVITEVYFLKQNTLLKEMLVVQGIFRLKTNPLLVCVYFFHNF